MKMHPSPIRLCLVAFLAILPALPIIAQEGETAHQKAVRLAVRADANPRDWRAQYEAGLSCQADSADAAPNFELAEAYLKRACDLAQAQPERRDTVLPKSLVALEGLCWAQDRIDEALDYGLKALQAYVDEFGLANPLVTHKAAELASSRLLVCFADPGRDPVEALSMMRQAVGLNLQLPEEQRVEGLDRDNPALLFAHELVMAEHVRNMRGKGWAWKDPDDGERYFVLAFDGWTCDSPCGLLAWLWYNALDNRQAPDRECGFVVMDEKGRVKELEHPTMDFSLGFNISPEDRTYQFVNRGSLHIMDFSPELRQLFVQALADYRRKKQEKQ